MDRLSEAEKAANDAINLHQLHGNDVLLAWGLNTRATIFRCHNRFDSANGDLARAMEICRKSGDRHLAMMTLLEAASLHQAQGRMKDAETAYWSALVLAREYGDPIYIIKTSSALFTFLLNIGNKIAARAVANQMKDFMTQHQFTVPPSVQEQLNRLDSSGDGGATTAPVS